MTVLDDLLFVLVLLEGSVCLGAAYAILLLAAAGFHDRLPLHLGVFAVAAAALVLTAALADGFRTHHQRRQSR
ncbi:MAG TPA: hypothetical protein VFE37_11835 [Chloroflexota bacterium]|nr:hypothetical protein [Chloroflexota bacterium]